MQVTPPARNWEAHPERLAVEILCALILTGIYVGAEFCWDLLGSQPSIGRIGLAVATSLLAWLLVRALIPGWPVGRRLLLCIAVCVALDATAQVRTIENTSYFGTVHTGADDSFYLRTGNEFANLLADVDGLDTYAHVYACLPETPHVGFIVLLGHLFQFIPADELSRLRAVVLLNLLVLQILAALTIRLGRFSPSDLRVFVFLFVIPGFDVFFFGAAIAKDPVIGLLLVALTASLVDLVANKATFKRVAGLLLIGVALFFLRNFYVLLPPLGVVLTRLRSQQGGLLRRLLVQGATALAALAVVMLVRDSLWFQQSSAFEVGSRKISESGWGATIYNIPAAGPLIYALITPLPPRLTDLANGAPWTDMVRFLGTVAILILLATTIAAATRTRMAGQKSWMSFIHVGVLVFLTSAYGSIEARHRIASLPCLIVCYGLVRHRRRATMTDRIPNLPRFAAPAHLKPIPSR